MSNIFDLEFYKAESGKVPVQDFYFTYFNNKYIMLHGFVKKTMKIPKNEIEKARKYMEDYKRMHYE